MFRYCLKTVGANSQSLWEGCFTLMGASTKKVLCLVFVNQISVSGRPESRISNAVLQGLGWLVYRRMQSFNNLIPGLWELWRTCSVLSIGLMQTELHSGIPPPAHHSRWLLCSASRLGRSGVSAWMALAELIFFQTGKLAKVYKLYKPWWQQPPGPPEALQEIQVGFFNPNMSLLSLLNGESCTSLSPFWCSH